MAACCRRRLSVGGAILNADAIGGRLTGLATADGVIFSADAIQHSWVESAFTFANLYLGIPLGLIGFWFAIVQIQQARTAAREAKVKAGEAKDAADAAKAAAESARSQFKTMSVSVLLPQLRNLEEAIERAIHDRSLILLMHLLQDWRWQASTCRGYLDGSITAEAEAMTDIQKSVIAATILKPKLVAFTADTDWAKETGRVRKSMADVTANLGALTAQNTVKESR